MATQSNILAWRFPWTKSLADNGPWGHKESYRTVSNTFPFHLKYDLEKNTAFYNHFHEYIPLLKKTFLSKIYSICSVIFNSGDILPLP